MRIILFCNASEFKERLKNVGPETVNQAVACVPDVHSKALDES